VVVNASGGTPQYQYSMDNTTWQTSNTFLNISRGMHKVYVKDSYNCAPIVINITVPNIINVITPNGDGKNDHIDYSALSDKLDLTFTIFDRYGATLHVADKSNNYRWDGTANGRKAPTGNYWYTLTWTENNKNKTPVKFSGWIMVKNRE
jgi:gliding motility-associated-like protein